MDIVWHALQPADDALRSHVAAVYRVDAGEVTIGRHCPACGSDVHGRPWLRLPHGPSPRVSLSRCGAHVVTVVADDPVGIDVESIAAVDARWDPDLVLHPGESADTPAERAATWCRKEAVLKALGTGLRTPMPDIRWADWPVRDLPAPAGLAASVVVIRQSGSDGRSVS